MDDLKQRAVRGGLAKMASQALTLVCRLGSLMVLARVLSPGDFGLVAMVTALTGLLDVFRDVGLSAAAVQRTTITDDQMSTLFWINVLVGAVLSGIAVLCAPAIAHFYNEPRLVWITIAIAGTFFVRCASAQHGALLKRQMRFVLLAAIEACSLLVAIAVAIAMALTGFGYWSLVAMTAAMPIVYGLLVWLFGSWTPGPPRRSPELGAMIRFGGTVTLNGIVVYAAYNLEKVLLGRFWGAEALGTYGRAYQLVNIPTENLNSALGEVAFSTLARVKDDPERFKAYFLTAYSFVVAITIPVTLACGLFAPQLVRVLLGPQWDSAAPIFRLLAPTILVYAMINPLWWVMASKGLVVRSLRIALVLAPLVMLGYVLGLPYGPVGVAFGFSAVMLLWLVPHIIWCVHGTEISPGDVFRSVGRPLASGLGAAAVSWFAVNALGVTTSPWVDLSVGLSVLGLVYGLTLILVFGQGRLYLNLLRSLKDARSSDALPSV